MALPSLSFPTFSPSKPSISSFLTKNHPFLQFKPIHSLLHLTRRSIISAAAGSNGKFYPTPAEDDPPEAPEDAGHGVSKFQQIHRQAARARKLQEEQFKKDQSTFLSAIADVEDAPDNPERENADSAGDDIFGEIDKAIALKRKEFVKQGLLKPNPKKKEEVVSDVNLEGIEELSPEEVVDLDEIQELQGLTVISEEPNEEDLGEEINGDSPSSSLSSFDLDFDNYGKTKPRILEPKFKMTLAELLDESRVVPVSVYGNLEVEITGIQHDSREVCSGDLFVCCVGMKTDGHLYLSEADKRGAVAVVASKEIDIDETLGCKALVIVEDTNAVLPALAASFYRNPSKKMSVIGVTGTNGKTTTAYLIKGVYEAMALRTGMLSTVAYYVHGDNKLESPHTTPDAVLVQKLMAKMLHNGAETVVMEASSHGLSLGRCDEVDFDIAVFTNLTRDHMDFHQSEEEYRDAKAKLFARMVDPDRHRKIVNIDDPNAPFFIAQGNPDVPVVTFAMENKSADVRALKFELSLFETQVLVSTPQGILEISSGLLGRHNIYNILAAVSVGIAVGAPLEDIVRGIEEVDGVPGRCELIDEEQAFGVIVDYAHTPDGLSRLLDSVRELGPRRIITVFGCAGERDRGKRPMMTKIATDKSDVTILTSDNPRGEDPLDILDDMLAGVGWTMQDYLKYGENDYYPPLPNGHRLFLHDIRRVAVRAAVAMGEEGDMVVVAGKGHETHQIEGDKKEFFDDREECREALQYVDELHQAGIDTSEFPWRSNEDSNVWATDRGLSQLAVNTDWRTVSESCWTFRLQRTEESGYICICKHDAMIIFLRRKITLRTIPGIKGIEEEFNFWLQITIEESEDFKMKRRFKRGLMLACEQHQGLHRVGPSETGENIFHPATFFLTSTYSYTSLTPSLGTKRR
ncbi:Mur ligase [Macleaya cordata]|uniref:UDP-N-acetylmuramoyl-L-alanyl-D-glutamate--2,6-diaminopimelate ligase MurE homolog, chloroplastic n=1 Tax=Macleaya cordata TaxID=56857 RepID=A0A200QUA9_MACCD|nr:Mur ligase [Macleaya cordata]